MPQLSDVDTDGGMTGGGETATLDRLTGSSKRFGRQRNKRFNTVGVSREELADARLYLQKKLLSENLASSGTSSSSGHASMEHHQNILDDDAESRRKSLNLQFDNDWNADLDRILEKGRSSFSKSIDIAPPPQRNIITVATAITQLDAEPKVVLRRKVSAPSTENQQRQQTNGNGQRHNGKTGNNIVKQNSDSEDETSETHSHGQSNGGVPARPMNKFSLRKLKMKRANTIDIPKSQPFDDFNTYAGSDENVPETNAYNNTSPSVNGVRRAIQDQCNPEVDRNHVPPLQVKTSSDQKYLSFLNKQNNENRMSWMNPSRGSASPQGKVATNWSNKFGNIKNSFERHEPPVSPGLAKKNNFTHAPTSPFLPVHSSKPPQIPNGHSPQYQQTHQVSQKIAAIHSTELAEKQPFEPRPILKSHKSMPSEMKQPSANGRIATKWSNKFASVDNPLEHVPTSLNPLYVPLHQSTAKQAPLPLRSPSRTPVSHGEFPAYTYTCTDYTRPKCVSTFGPETSVSPVKNQILPDTSYIKNQSPQRSLQPSLGTMKLSKNMRTVDYTSSSECLSESNSSYRSPHPFGTNRIYADNSYSDAKTPDEQEFMATSQIMKYPESQTATMVINKTKRYDQDEERVAKNLHSFLTNNVHAKPQLGDYPANDTYFNVNKTYVPAATVAPAPNVIRNNVNANHKINNFVSMENLSYQQKPIQQAAPLKSAFSTHGLNSQSISSKPASVVNERKFTAAKNQPEKPKQTQAIKVNSYGSQYMPPKVVDPAFDGTPFRIQKKDHATMNSISGLNRSNTIVHRRPPPIEIKRKQSLPGQGTDYASLIDQQTHSPPSHDREYNDDDADEPRNNYLPTGILKRSKSGHTLALLQQFESKERSKGPSAPLLPSQPLKSALKQTTTQAPKPAPRSNLVENKPIDVPKPVSKPATQPAPQASPNHLDAPKITETPSSPIVDEERIIYPGQTVETQNKIKNYAQTLNAMHSRKTTINSAIVSEEIKTGATPTKGILQKSKSGTLLSIPKPFESQINKADAEEKQRTVAAYFSGVKSPQGLQRSSSQHSMLSSSSTKSMKTSNEHIDINGNNTEIVDRTVSTFESSAAITTNNTKSTTKSAHHLKILKKQQKQSATNALPLAKSQTMPHISSVNLLDENNVDDAFEDLFLSFNK